MHIPTHILSGWCLGNALPIGPRGRLNCMIAASGADFDGCGIAFGQEAYWRYHHTVGHNVFFGLIVAGLLTARSTGRRGLAFVAYLACFHLHLLMDYYGSGPGWAIEYLWPIDRTGWRTNYAWELTSWQNRVAFAVLLAITVAIGWGARRTPLEVIAPRLDALLLGRSHDA